MKLEGVEDVHHFQNSPCIEVSDWFREQYLTNQGLCLIPGNQTSQPTETESKYSHFGPVRAERCYLRRRQGDSAANLLIFSHHLFSPRLLLLLYHCQNGRTLRSRLPDTEMKRQTKIGAMMATGSRKKLEILRVSEMHAEFGHDIDIIIDEPKIHFLDLVPTELVVHLRSFFSKQKFQYQ